MSTLLGNESKTKNQLFRNKFLFLKLYLRNER